MQEILSFLNHLAQNNNRAWFAAHKHEHDAARRFLIGFIEKLIESIGDFDADIKGLQANQCIFRIYRDTRFSKNKLPYKNNMGAYFSKGGKQLHYAGYYLHIQPGESFIAGGIYMPESDVLKSLRQEIYFNSESLIKILTAPGFKKYFQQLDDYKLKTIPKGYEKDHPAIALLRHTSFVASHSITDRQLCSNDFLQYTSDVFRAISPLVRWLNDAIDQAE